MDLLLNSHIDYKRKTRYVAIFVSPLPSTQEPRSSSKSMKALRQYGSSHKGSHQISILGPWILLGLGWSGQAAHARKMTYPRHSETPPWGSLSTHPAFVAMERFHANEYNCEIFAFLIGWGRIQKLHGGHPWWWLFNSSDIFWKKHIVH